VLSVKLVTVGEAMADGVAPDVVVRETEYDVAPGEAPQESDTFASPGVAVIAPGTVGGVHTGVPEATAELADQHEPLLAATT
jgi:hypothetical protein